MRATRASAEQVSEFIKLNDGWTLVEEKLQKKFVFLDFTQAFSFMTRIAKYAEENDHHPEWFNVYRRVNVDLTTHDVSGVSELDFLLAQEMDSVVRDLGR